MNSWVAHLDITLLALFITGAAYAFGLWAARGLNHHPLMNPVALAIAGVVATLALLRIDYATYFSGARWLHFLLGPATVALAVPLVQRLAQLRRYRMPVLVGLGCGAVASTLSALGLAWALGASPQTLRSLAAKSVTTPIAMGISERIGGVASLTAVYCIATGILGAVLAPYVFAWMGVRPRLAGGLALGTAAHGIGTARAFQWHPDMGAFAGLALGLHGVLAALVLPFVAHELGWAA